MPIPKGATDLFLANRTGGMTMDTKPDLESQTKREIRWIYDAMIGLVGIAVLLWAIYEVQMWSAGQPDPSAYLPRWLTADPAPEAVLPTEGN